MEASPFGVPRCGAAGYRKPYPRGLPSTRNAGRLPGVEQRELAEGGPRLPRGLVALPVEEALLDVAEEGRGLLGAHLPSPEPAAGAGEEEEAPRAGHAHEEKAPLLGEVLVSL